MDLIRLALAAEKLARDHPPVTAVPLRCLRTNDKSAACTLCEDLCPVAAIQVRPSPTVNAEACIRCGLCLHRCPTGVFEGEDGARQLFYCVSQLVDHDSLELACAFHPNPGPGQGDVDAVITTNGCLAAFGPATYLGLAALGVHHLSLRLDACATCALAGNRAEIELGARQAQALLTALGRPNTVQVAGTAKRPGRRQIVSVKNPPVSRRAFFQSLTGSSGPSTESLLADAPGTSGDKRAPRERRRLLNALRAFTPKNPDLPLTVDGFAKFSASDSCTACELCAQVCPTGALRIQKDEQRYTLTFSPAECTDCGLCLKFCADGALKRTGHPTAAELLAPARQNLHSGSLVRCRKCGGLYTRVSGNGLCPTCDFRKKNPFGSVAVIPGQSPKSPPNS